MKSKLGFIGFGNMAQAIIKNLLESRLVRSSDISVHDRLDERKGLAEKWKIRWSVSNQEVADNSKIVIIAVKPQNIDEVLDEIDAKGRIFASICAGVTTRYIKKKLGDNITVVRLMPNTPFLIGEGVTGAYMTGDRRWKNEVNRIFSSGSEVIWFNDESYLDRITAFSGSGPAYLFYFAEALEESGKKLGFSDSEARRIALGTIKGSIDLLEKTGESPGSLRKKVTSPNGTTEQAVKHLERRHFKKIFSEAVKKAYLRAKELKR
ncbi:MAG TPA: pyrroline-5-carboxylate reductase [bacterium]|nr:pyrroline-5-carboxylate reductase [bacterium]